MTRTSLLSGVRTTEPRGAQRRDGCAADRDRRTKSGVTWRLASAGRRGWLRRVLPIAFAAALAACGTTGGDLVSFDVTASGPPTAAGPGFAIDNGLGWHVMLDQAQLHIGAIYLNRSVPSSGAQVTSCILPGVYTAQELAGLTVDVLSATPQPFPARGTGTSDLPNAAELWLTGGDINASSDTTVIAELAGTASRAAAAIPFTARITIGANRLIPPSDPAQPSMHPICKQRIVSPILLDDLRPSDGGTLRLRIDPAPWFANVDFTSVAPGAALPDDLTTPASQNLFSGLRSAGGTYTFTFEERTPP